MTLVFLEPRLEGPFPEQVRNQSTPGAYQALSKYFLKSYLVGYQTSYPELVALFESIQGRILVTCTTFNHLLEWFPPDQLGNLWRNERVKFLAMWDDPIIPVLNYIFTYEGAFPTHEIFSSPRWGLDFKSFFLNLFASERFYHVGWDSGHLKALRVLMDTEPVQVMIRPTLLLDSFFASPEELRTYHPSSWKEVVYGGNIMTPSDNTETWDTPYQSEEAHAILGNVLQLKMTNMELSATECLDMALKSYETQTCRRPYPVQSMLYWNFVDRLMRYYFSGPIRAHYLTRCGSEVSVYGMFVVQRDTMSIFEKYPHLKYCGHIPRNQRFAPYYNEKICLCVSNGICFQGFPGKFMEYLAAGGLGICDRKADLSRLFGGIFNEVSYNNLEGMNTLIERYKAKPKLAFKIAREMNNIVRQISPADVYVREVMEYFCLVKS